MGKDTLSGAQIQNLRERMLRLLGTSPAASQHSAKLSEKEIRPDYVSQLIKLSRDHIGKRKLKVVVDAGNGVGGLVGPQVLRELGVEVIELYCEPDGRFPNHHPDPTVLENIEELIHTVRAQKADFGIGWDGDADRIGVVDERGEVIFGDMLVLIFAREILNSVPGATIIGDVKCSSLLFDDVRKRGGTPIMWKTGHSLIKSKLKETQGALGGEMSGHIAFSHRFYGFDDALYSSARLVEIMSKTSQPLSQLLGDLPRMVSTPEIRLECAEELKFKIAKQAQSAFSEYNVNTIDGVRVQFEHGWALIRASNTQPVLVMRFEAASEKFLKEYQDLVNQRLEKLKQTL